MDDRPTIMLVHGAWHGSWCWDSVRAALQTLAGIGRRTGRPTVAVLGEMRELGEASAAEHAAVAATAQELGISRVYVVGEGARAIYDAFDEANDTAVFCPSVHEGAQAVRNNVDGTEVVLVKASRAAGLERIADALLAGDDIEEADL